MKAAQDSHHMAPDYHATVPAEFYGHVARFAEALSTIEFGEVYDGMKVEIDNVPVTWDGCTVGFLVISEIDGKTWEWAPAIVDRELSPDAPRDSD